MSMVKTNPKPRFRGRLAHTILFALLPLSLVPVILVGGLLLLSSYRILREQATTQLSTIVQNHTSLMNLRVTAKEDFLERLSSSGTFGASLDKILEQGQAGLDFDHIRQELFVEYDLASRGELELPLHYMMVVLPDTSILASTNKAWEGKKLAGNKLFEEALAEQKSLAVYNTEPLHLNQLMLLTVKPYPKGSKHPSAFLVGMTDPLWDLTLIETGTGLHSDVKVYFYTKDDFFLSFDRTNREIIPLQLGPKLEAALLPKLIGEVDSDFTEFNSFDNQAVIAFAANIPEIGAGMVAELPKSSFSAPLLKYLPALFGILIVSIAVMAGLVWIGSQRLVKPLLLLTDITIKFAEGDWHQRSEVKRNDEIGLLAYSFNQMAEEITNLYRQMEGKIEERTKQMKTAAEVAQVATSAPNLKELLQRTVHLLVERFGYENASIFLLDDTGEYATLIESAGEEIANRDQELKYSVGSHSLVGWVTKYNRSRVAADVSNDPFYMQDDHLVETRSQAVVPISIGDHVLGAINVNSKVVNSIGPEDVDVIQTLSNQIAFAIENIRLLDATQVNLEEASLVYHASRQIAKAETKDEILQAVVHALQQTDYQSITLSLDASKLRLVSIFNPQTPRASYSIEWEPVSPQEVDTLLPTGNSLLITDFKHPPRIPEILHKTLLEWKCESAAFIPVIKSGQLAALIILSTSEKEVLTPTSMQPFANLAEMTSTALEKIDALQTMEKRLLELQALNTISEAITGQTDIYTLYGIVHQAITRFMGVVNFLIAIYDPETQMVHAPYMYEEDRIVSVDPFPLGQGLTSILIRSKQPLMLVEDTERRTKELGAIVLGDPAKSWLGVPLIVGGEVIGALIVQDLEHEHRFNEDDQRLLMTAGAHIAAAIRNARLLDKSRKQADRERLLQEVTKKIRNSTDMRTILATTASEISKNLGIHRAKIEIKSRTLETESASGNRYEETEDIKSDALGGQLE